MLDDKQTPIPHLISNINLSGLPSYVLRTVSACRISPVYPAGACGI